MTAKQLNKNKRQKRRLQIRLMKATLLLLAIVLPLLLLPSKKRVEQQSPMQIAALFVDNLIHAQVEEACGVATPQSADDIHFYATWVQDAIADNPDNIRFTATHVLIPNDDNTIGYVKGVVSVQDNEGQWSDIHILTFRLVEASQRGWVVDYDMNNVVWCR